MSTLSPTCPCTADVCVDGGRPPQITYHSRVVELLHDVTAQVVMILYTCFPEVVKWSPAPPFPLEPGRPPVQLRRGLCGRMRMMVPLWLRPR